MKYFAFILFLTFSHHAVTQFSISGGYDHRSEDTALNFKNIINIKNHFTAPAKNSFHRYNVGYLKVGYRINKRYMLTSELGFSKKSIDCYKKTESDVTTWYESYTTKNYYRSTLSYSSLTMNLGINRIIEWKGLLLKKVNHALVLGTFIQPEFLINYKNDNKTIQTVKKYHLNNSNQPDVVLQDETISTETSLYQANKARINVGLSLAKRTQFHSIFIEYKVKFSVSVTRRFEQKEDLFHGFFPVLETGIGVGYQFNKRKTKPVASISIN